MVQPGAAQAAWPKAPHPEPDAPGSRHARPEESAVHCPDDAAFHRAGLVLQGDAAARRAVQAAVARRAPLSEPRACAEVRERPLVQQAAQQGRPSALRAHVGVPELPWGLLRAVRHEGPPEAARAVRRAVAGERDVQAAVRPWEAQAAALLEVPAAEHAAAEAERPSAARVARLSAAPWALPSDRARLARRRMRSSRSALRSRQLREAATATAPRSRWWQEGAV